MRWGYEIESAETHQRSKHTSFARTRPLTIYYNYSFFLCSLSCAQQYNIFIALSQLLDIPFCLQCHSVVRVPETQSCVQCLIDTAWTSIINLSFYLLSLAQDKWASEREREETWYIDITLISAQSASLSRSSLFIFFPFNVIKSNASEWDLWTSVERERWEQERMERERSLYGQIESIHVNAQMLL